MAADRLAGPGDTWTDGQWDAWVRVHPRATYLQTAAWARVKASNGWLPTLVVAGSHEAPIGARLLSHGVGPLPWRIAYAPRGPLAAAWSSDAFAAWTEAIRGARGPARAALIRIDPEIEDATASDDGPLFVEAARRLGWRSTADVQPSRTRIIDLTADEAALWSGLRSKWRQYVNKARSTGIVVSEVDPVVRPDAYDLFGSVMRETRDRAGVPVRSTRAYRELDEAFRPTGDARLLFAETADGDVLAVLLVVRCGARVAELYGGMTGAGAEARANYQLKWEAIRSSREQGAISYDMWGLPTPGIAHFKEGFGGREVRYVGAWDLDRGVVGGAAIRAGEAGRRLGARALWQLRSVVPGRSTDGADPGGAQA